MLAQLFENLLVSLINLLTRNAGRPGARGNAPNPLTRLLSRLAGRGTAASAQPPAPPADPPVVVGDVVPSRREALREPRPEPREAALSTEERLRHVLMTGGTGAGKTTLLLNMVDADVAAGRGVGFFDMRGDMADRVLVRLAARHAPEELADRLLLVDLRTPPDGVQRAGAGCGGPAHTVGFDPLAQGANPHAQAGFVMDVLRQQFGGSLGCQTEELCRNLLLAMALSPLRPPLADVELFLASPDARSALLAGVEDRGVLRFFARFEALPEAQRGQWVSPVLNKITPMLSLPALRRSLGDARSVCLRDFLGSRPDPILLVALGADETFAAATLAGTLLVNAVASAFVRSDRTNGAAPFFLYLDEFENLAGGASEKFETLVSEARRYGLGLTLSHQSTSQLEPRLRVLARNVITTHVVFGTGGADADLLSGEIASEEPKALLKHLLLTQKPGEALLSRRGQTAVRIRTRYAPDPAVPAAAVRALREASLMRHGRPSAAVDAEALAREAAFLAPPPPPAPVRRDGRARRPRTSKPARHADAEPLEVRDHDA